MVQWLRIHLHVKQTASGKLLYNTGSSAQCSVTIWGGWRVWEGGPRGRGYMYTYSWFTMLYSRNKHNIVKQLFLKTNKYKLKKRETLTCNTGDCGFTPWSGNSDPTCCGTNLACTPQLESLWGTREDPTRHNENPACHNLALTQSYK